MSLGGELRCGLQLTRLGQRRTLWVAVLRFCLLQPVSCPLKGLVNQPVVLPWKDGNFRRWSLRERLQDICDSPPKGVGGISTSCFPLCFTDEAVRVSFHLALPPCVASTQTQSRRAKQLGTKTSAAVGPKNPFFFLVCQPCLGCLSSACV